MYDNEIKEALKGVIIKGISQRELTEKTARMLSAMYVVLGFRLPDTETFSTIVTHLIKTLRICHSFLTFEEVKLCFEMGSRGDFGEFVGMNILTFSSWLNSYRNSDARSRVLKQIDDEQRRAEAEVRRREAEKDFNFEACVQSCYDSFLQYGTERLFLAPFVFQRLREMKLINVSDREYEKLVNRFAEESKRREERNGCRTPQRLNEILMEKIFSSAESKAGDYFVIDYFNRLKEFDMKEVPFDTVKPSVRMGT